MDERRCGTCRQCERYDVETGALYDPWGELDELLRSRLHETLGICDMEGECPIAVYLDGTMPCGGDFWERGRA